MVQKTPCGTKRHNGLSHLCMWNRIGSRETMLAVQYKSVMSLSSPGQPVKLIQALEIKGRHESCLSTTVLLCPVTKNEF